MSTPPKKRGEELIEKLKKQVLTQNVEEDDGDDIVDVDGTDRGATSNDSERVLPPRRTQLETAPVCSMGAAENCKAETFTGVASGPATKGSTSPQLILPEPSILQAVDTILPTGVGITSSTDVTVPQPPTEPGASTTSEPTTPAKKKPKTGTDPPKVARKQHKSKRKGLTEKSPTLDSQARFYYDIGSLIVADAKQLDSVLGFLGGTASPSQAGPRPAPPVSISPHGSKRVRSDHVKVEGLSKLEAKDYISPGENLGLIEVLNIGLFCPECGLRSAKHHLQRCTVEGKEAVVYHCPTV